jgi:microcystin-dependent protein
MSDPYLGEIRLFAFNYAPEGWNLCDGTKLLVNDYPALFSIIGTIYGGDGVTKFALPDYRGRLVVGVGQGPGLSNYAPGAIGGAETVALTAAQVPAHSHVTNYVKANAVVETELTGLFPGVAVGHVVGHGALPQVYSATAANASLAAGSVSPAFGGIPTPHDNISPYMGLSYAICINGGVYPSPDN